MTQFDEPVCSDPQFELYSSRRKVKISLWERRSLKNEYLLKGGLHRSQAPGLKKESGYT